MLIPQWEDGFLLGSTNVVSGTIRGTPYDIIFIWSLGDALLGNGGNSLFSMDLKPPMVTRNRVIN